MLSPYDLTPKQRQAIEFLKGTKRAALWADLGEGKTVISETALLEAPDMRPALVIGPMRVARSVWRNELQRWSHLGGLTLARALGDPLERTTGLLSGADIVTINRDNVPWLEEFYIQGKRQVRRFPFRSLILDESQSFKSSDGVWFRSLRRLRKLADRVIELTGTPAPNGLQDLWAQFYLLDRGERLGHGITAFRDRWMDAVQMDGYADWRMRPTASAEIYSRIADLVFVLRNRATTPPKFNPIWVELPLKALGYYRQMEELSITRLFNEKVITGVNSGATTQKLLQMANGAVYDADKAWHEIHTEKVDALIETLDGLPKPVMIAYGFKHDCERAGRALAGRNWRILDTERDEDDWNAGRIDYLLLHPASAGHGLNLQHSGSTEIVWFGLTHNLEWFQQLNARLAGGHRGVGRSITIHLILSEHTIDASVLNLLMRKDAKQEDLKEALASRRAACLTSSTTPSTNSSVRPQPEVKPATR